MKEIFLRTSISLILLSLSYLTGLAVDKFSLPQILVVGFIISQCLNECVSYLKLSKKEKEILALKRKISMHHDMAEEIYDEDDRPKDKKVALKALKVEMLKTLTSEYAVDDVKNGNEKQTSAKRMNSTPQEMVKGFK